LPLLFSLFSRVTQLNIEGDTAAQKGDMRDEERLPTC
jgi:hypothetical protein